jgi:hypothetical protein
VLLLSAAGAVWFYLNRQVTQQEMLARLPLGDGPTVYLDVASLRQGGLLDMIAGPRMTEDADYRGFVAATGFDYRRDLDAVFLTFRENGRYLVVSGRFDRGKLAQYAEANGGRCAGELCAVLGSTPDRKISYLPLGQKLLGMAVSQDSLAAAALKRRAQLPEDRPSTSALFWLYLPGAALKPRAELPPAANAVLALLEGAEKAAFTLRPTGTEFSFVLESVCANEKAARTKAATLTQAGELLKPFGAPVGSAFQVEGRIVRGSWPLSMEWLKSVAIP